jgi:hypothetical protein
MRRAATVFSAVVLAGLVTVIVVGATHQPSEAFSLGVGSRAPVLQVRAGDELCQRPIEPVHGFERISLTLGSNRRPGPEVRVEVRDASGGRMLGVGTLPGGWPDVSAQTVDVGTIERDGRIVVCLRNLSSHPFAPYGESGLANRSSAAYRNERRLEADVSMIFIRDREASVLSFVPDMVDRASLFHGEWVGAWTVWLVLALVALAVPALLVVALRSVEE